MKTIGNGKEISGKLTNILRGITPTATLWDGNIGFAYQDDGGAFTDLTAAANSAAANDVALLPAAEAINDAFYFGENFAVSGPFNSLKINIGTAGVGTAIAWEYWNGAAWAALTVTDGTNGFTVAGSSYVTWTIPGDWTHTTVNGQDRYWVRARVTAALFTTQPLATQIWLGRYPTSLSNATDGDVSTVSGQGTVQMGALGLFGNVIIDLGSVKTVMVGGKFALWSAANQITVYLSVSDDGITYDGPGSGVVVATTTTETTVFMNTKTVKGRYLKFQFYLGTGATTIYVKLYELFGYEVLT